MFARGRAGSGRFEEGRDEVRERADGLKKKVWMSRRAETRSVVRTRRFLEEYF